MKELTIEQKAKAYDETICRAMIEYNHSSASKEIKDVLNYIFQNSELAKSDDEGIRKKLISYFSAVKGFSTLEYNYGITNEDAVDWLEKQGGQESVNYQIDYMSELTPFELVFHRIATKYAQNLQKEEYRKAWYTKERAAEMLCHAMKQKFAWSEEDKELLEDAIHVVKTRDNAYGQETSKTQNWLNSLRPQKQWKPNEEQLKELKQL